MSYDNAVNDNKLNDRKSKSPMYLVKRLVKSVLRKGGKNTYKKNPQPSYFVEDEVCDNLANEILENEIFEEIDTCEEFSAVPVYQEGEMHLMEVRRGQRFVPVNFARTEAGTFFWTSLSRPDSDIAFGGDENAICSYQVPQIQVPCDRWAQA